MGDKYPNPKNRFVRYPNTSTQTHSDLVWGVPPNQMTRTTNPLYSLELSSNVSPQDVLLNPSNPLVASTSINEAESNPCNASDGVRGQSQLRCGDYLSQYFGDPHNNAATSGVGNIYFNVDLGNHNEAWPSVPQAPQDDRSHLLNNSVVGSDNIIAQNSCANAADGLIGLEQNTRLIVQQQQQQQQRQQRQQSSVLSLQPYQSHQCIPLASTPSLPLLSLTHHSDPSSITQHSLQHQQQLQSMLLSAQQQQLQLRQTQSHIYGQDYIISSSAAAFGNQNIYAHAQEAASHNSFTVPIALNSSASCERLLPTPTATGTSTPLPCLVPESYSQHQPQPQQRNHETNDDGRINSENIVSVQQQLVDLMTGIQGSQKSLQLKQKQNDWLNQGAFYQESSEYGLLSSHEDNSTPCSTTINSNQCQEPLQTQDFCHQSQNLDLQQLHKHQGIHGLVHDFTSGSSTPSSNCGLHTLVMPDIYEDFESTLNQGQLRKILSTDHPVDSAVHTPSQVDSSSSLTSSSAGFDLQQNQQGSYYTCYDCHQESSVHSGLSQTKQEHHDIAFSKQEAFNTITSWPSTIAANTIPSYVYDTSITPISVTRLQKETSEIANNGSINLKTSKNQENLRDCVTPLSMNTSPVGRIAVNDCWIKVESNKQLSMPVSGAIETQLWGHIFRSADNKELFFAQFAEYNNYRSQDCGLNDDSDDSDDSDGNGDNDNNDDDSSDSDNDGYVQSGVDDQNDGNVDFSSDSQRSSGSHSSSRGRSCIRGLGRGRGRGRGRGGRPYTSQKTTIVNPRPPPVQDSVTIASERLLLCTFPHCTRTFTTIGLLKSHLVSHNDAKPYWCDICSPDGIVPRDPTPPEHPALSATAPEVKRYKRHHDLLRHKREQHPPLEVRIQRALEKLAAKEARKAKAALAKASQDNGRRRSTKKTTNSVATATMVPVATTLTVHGQTATLAQCSIQASNLFTTATNMTTMATNTAIPSTSTMTAIPEVIQVSTASHKRKLMDSGHSNRSSEGNEEVNDSSYQGSHAKNFRTSRRRSRTTPTQSTSTQGQIQDSEVSSPSQNHSHSVYESSDSE